MEKNWLEKILDRKRAPIAPIMLTGYKCLSFLISVAETSRKNMSIENNMLQWLHPFGQTISMRSVP